MSTTFTLPVSANDAFRHGQHEHTSSLQLSHQRQKSGNRRTPLSPSFPLTRGSIGSLTQTNRNAPRSPLVMSSSMEDETYGTTARNGFPLAHRISPRPGSDSFGVEMTKKRKVTISDSAKPAANAYKSRPRNVSRPTQLLLQTTENYSLLHGILADPESRRIFYFMMLNLTFMVVQSTYGVLTGSLGLISDSIHMFFDCVALLVGVCAAVMSKWPPSVKFPYGYGKVDTLAGLGNGIFLMLISVEIVYEAVERLFSGADISRTNELLVVSILGLAVNAVGILSFHGHHGHDHGHSHGHSHGNSHSHGHDHKSSEDNGHHHHHHHDHDHAHEHTNGHSAAHGHHHRDHSSKPSMNAGLLMDGKAMSPGGSPKRQKSAVGGHVHGSENMQGIYLHIMADALGSLSVVLSTILVKFTGWNGWDPVASCLIAVLIFASTVPLVTSTTRILLLSLDADVEYNLRDVLGGVSNIKGVVGHAVPKFWLEDIKKESGHGHHHHHGQSHDHPHDHGHHQQQRSVSCDSNGEGCVSEDSTVLGMIHVIASHHANLEDVQFRVQQYLESRKMDVVVQVEFEGEGRCWCGGSNKSG